MPVKVGMRRPFQNGMGAYVHPEASDMYDFAAAKIHPMSKVKGSIAEMVVNSRVSAAISVPNSTFKNGGSFPHTMIAQNFNECMEQEAMNIPTNLSSLEYNALMNMKEKLPANSKFPQKPNSETTGLGDVMRMRVKYKTSYAGKYKPTPYSDPRRTSAYIQIVKSSRSNASANKGILSGATDDAAILSEVRPNQKPLQDVLFNKENASALINIVIKFTRGAYANPFDLFADSEFINLTSGGLYKIDQLVRPGTINEISRAVGISPTAVATALRLLSGIASKYVEKQKADSSAEEEEPTSTSAPTAP